MDSRTDLKPKTREGYEGLLNTVILPELGDMPLARIEPTHIQKFVADASARGLSASRVRGAYPTHSVLKVAVQSRYLAADPCARIKLPRPTHREMLFTDAQGVERLAAAAQEPYGRLIHVLAYAGLRWGEATALRRGRCALLRRRVHVMESLSDVRGEFHFGPTKTYATRAVAIPTFLVEKLAAHLEHYVSNDPAALVFTSSTGAPLRNPTFHKRVWTPALHQARPTVHGGQFADLRIHDLRHTCAAMLIAQGAHRKLIQRHLDHSTIKVTFDTYGHLFPDKEERIADELDAAYRNLPRPIRVQPSDQDVAELASLSEK
jgi:integrase